MPEHGFDFFSHFKALSKLENILHCPKRLHWALVEGGGTTLRRLSWFFNSQAFSTGFKTLRRLSCFFNSQASQAGFETLRRRKLILKVSDVSAGFQTLRRKA